MNASLESPYAYPLISLVIYWSNINIGLLIRRLNIVTNTKYLLGGWLSRWMKRSSWNDTPTTVRPMPSKWTNWSFKQTKNENNASVSVLPAHLVQVNPLLMSTLSSHETRGIQGRNRIWSEARIYQPRPKLVLICRPWKHRKWAKAAQAYRALPGIKPPSYHAVR